MSQSSPPPVDANGMTVLRPPAALEQFFHACRVAPDPPGSEHPQLFDRASSYRTKRIQLMVQVVDFGVLVRDWCNRRRQAHPRNPNLITEMDWGPDFRVRNGVEHALALVYGCGEILGWLYRQYNRQASPGFRALLLSAQREGSPTAELLPAIGDAGRYLAVRELRTELTHHSAAFVGGTSSGDAEEPLVVFPAERRSGDLQYFADRAHLTLREVADLIRPAEELLDSVARFVLEQYVVPSIGPEREVQVPDIDDDGKVTFRRIPAQEFLAALGLERPSD